MFFQLYPFAVSLTESVNTYVAVCQRVESRAQLKTLLAERRNELVRLVQEGAELVWDSYKLENYTQSQGWKSPGPTPRKLT